LTHAPQKTVDMASPQVPPWKKIKWKFEFILWTIFRKLIYNYDHFFWQITVVKNRILLQCKPLNVITDNVIIRLMWSNCPRLSRSQITNKQALCNIKQSLIVIIRLMLSLSLCPKVITLSGFHCSILSF
jgi:hypothetical protein